MKRFTLLPMEKSRPIIPAGIPSPCFGCLELSHQTFCRIFCDSAVCSGLFRSSKDTYECMWEGGSAEQSECGGSSDVFLLLVWWRSMNSIPDVRHKSVIPPVSGDGGLWFDCGSTRLWCWALVCLWLIKEQKQNDRLFYFLKCVSFLFFHFILEMCESIHEHFYSSSNRVQVC